MLRWQRTLIRKRVDPSKTDILNFTQNGPEWSVLRSLLSEFGLLRIGVESVNRGDLSVSPEQPGSKTTLNHEDYISTAEPILEEPLIVRYS